MRDLLRNLRLPGRRPQPFPRGATSARPASGRGTAARREFALTRVEPPKSRRTIHIPWRRIGMTAGSAAMLAGVAYGAAWLATGDTFRVRAIDVVGAQIEHPRHVASAASIGNQSMFTVDLAAATRAVEALPGVRSAEAVREWPDSVRIEVVEHQAWGFWQVGTQPLVIDAEGRVLERARPAPPDAPVILELAGPRDTAEDAGVDADTVRLVARLLDDGAFRRLGVEPSGFVFRSDRGLTVLTEGGPDAIFGDSSNYEFKVQAWGGLVQQINADQIEAREIDLRFGRNVVLR